MPAAHIAKYFYTPQYAIGVARGGNIAERKCVSGEQARRDEFRRRGEYDVAHAAQLLGKEIIGRLHASVGQRHPRLIRPQLTKQYIETNHRRALGVKFIGNSAINLTRPQQAETVTEFTALDGFDARFFNGDKGQIGCHR